MAMRSQKWLCDCVGGAKSLGSGAEPGTDARYKSDSRAGSWLRQDITDPDLRFEKE